MAGEQPFETTGTDDAQPISLRLQTVSGEFLSADCDITLVDSEGQTIDLTAGAQAGEFVASVKPGEYTVQGQAGELVASNRPLTVEDRGQSVALVAGRPEWPTYRMGREVIPFEPQPEVIAVVPAGRHGDSTFDVRQAVQSLGLQAAPIPALEDAALGGLEFDLRAEATNTGAHDDIMMFIAGEDDTAPVISHSELRASLGTQARVGTPVDNRAGKRKFIDNRFVLRFVEDIDEATAEQRVTAAGATVIRRFPQSPNAFLVEFEAGTPFEHLEVVEQMHQEGVLVYGEPDLIAEAGDDAFPFAPPSDPTFANQDNLTLQGIDEAWKRLAEIDPLIATGSPRVYVCSLDRGIDVDHPDLGGVLTDGTPQMAQCFDFDGMRECTVPGYQPDTSHGMGVYGIIAAATNNADDIAGIASNTHHIGLERPTTIGTADYADVLMWAAGLETGNTTAGWPDEPLRNGADVISCSHGSNNLALSGLMDDTFQTLTRRGRGGLGTVVIYSAGNANSDIAGFRTWAAHPNTIAVANSLQPDATGVERKAGSSNFGSEIDICAQGAGAPSLDGAGGEQNFGGTSAAAPTVAAVAALMLSVNPTLTWRQVRDILRETAVQIDPSNTDPVGRWRNGFSQWYGFGRIDALACVERAKPSGGRTRPVDFDATGTADIPVVSRWGIGALTYSRGTFDSLTMIPNGTRVGGWLLNTADNRFDAMADFDGDRRTEMLVSSPWGISVFNVNPSGYSTRTIARNGTRLGDWLLNTADNRFGPVGNFDGDRRDDVLFSSPWGLAVMELNRGSFEPLMMARNGTRFGGWLLNTADNRFGPVGDFDGDGYDEMVISSPWGIGLLKLDGGSFEPLVMARNGTRLGDWLLNTADNRFRSAANFNDATREQLFVTSPWGIGVLDYAGGGLGSSAMARNGTRIGGWLLNTADNNFTNFGDITGDGRADVLLTSPWGIGVLSPRPASFANPLIARNGTRFGGWLFDSTRNSV